MQISDKTSEKGFIVESQMVKCSPLHDKGMSVGFHTKELPPQEQLEILKLFSQSGWLMFRPNRIEDEDVPNEDAEFETKTPSQRLRAVIYIYWEQSKKTEDFNTFYRNYMEKIINHIKQKLT